MIKGLSETMRCPRLGHIRLGIKDTNGGIEKPKEIDYFILDPSSGNRQRDNLLRDQFRLFYGEKPTRIMIMFPPVDKEIFFSQWNKRYGKGVGLKCRGDGHSKGIPGEAVCSDLAYTDGLKIIGEDQSGFKKVECLGRDCRWQDCLKPECRRSGNLQVILPDLDCVGTFQINTGSSNSIININSAIEWLIRVFNRYQLISLPLARVPQETTYKDGKGKRHKSLHYVLQIDLPLSLTQLRKAGRIPADSPLLAMPQAQELPPLEITHEEEPSPIPDVGSSEAIIEYKDHTEAPLWWPGKTVRFGDKKKVADNLMFQVKDCFDALGEKVFSQLLGSSGVSRVAEINKIEDLTELVNALLKERRDGEDET